VRLGLRGKILLITTGAVMVGLMVVLATSGYLFGNAYLSSLQSRSVAIAQGMRLQMDRILQLGIQMDNLLGFDKQCRDVVETYRGIDYAMVVNADDIIIFHNNTARHGEKLLDPELLSAVHQQVESTTQYSKNGSRVYGTIVPIRSPDGAYLGSVVVGMSASLIDEQRRSMVLTTFGVGMLFLGGGVFIILLTLAHFVTRPLQVVIQSIEALRADTSDLSRRVDWESADDLGRLAQAFNGLMAKLQETTVSKSSLESAYAALQASEEKNRDQKVLLDTVLNNVDAQVFMKDGEGRYLYANASTAVALGQSQAGMLGKRNEEIMPRKEAGRLRLMEQQMRESGQRVCGDEVLTHASGEVQHRWLMNIPLLEDGKVCASVGISTDITEVVRLKEQFELLANTDPMTGISNRRHLMAEAERELKRMRRDGGRLGVVVFDIDEFKSINDAYGHAVGDRAILAVVAACHRVSRDTDLFGRLGGDEFVVILPNTDLFEAQGVAERLREGVAKARVVCHEEMSISMTVSVGLALSDATSSLDEVLSRADVAMYEAKLRGRNGVWCEEDAVRG
jgi:diguanylate cyclase (GGDEF)-like protein/PAS domain S-box-containing protein